MPDEEEAALREADLARGPELPPLCPACRSRRLLMWTSDSRTCPLCARGGRSGSWLLCSDCAAEAGVCVVDAAPLDGSSAVAVPWLAELAAEQAEREPETAEPRGPGRRSGGRGGS